MKVGFIGLGAMGYPMARNLARQHEVVVWNRTTATAERHAADEGTALARELTGLAGCEVIVSVLPTSAEVDGVVSPLADLLPRGSLWIDATSGDPSTGRATAARLAERGIAFIDAPVSGGLVGAEGGTLTIMVGGTKEEFDRAHPILSAMGTRIVHVGPQGSGHAIKAVTNAMMAANLWVAAEAFLSLRKQGIETATAFEVVNGASGRSNVSENLLPQRLLHGEWPLAFKLSLLDKDVRIAASLAHELHLAAPVLALTSQLFTAARTALGEEADYIEVVRYAAAMNGETWD